MTIKIDKNGRIVIPKEIRELFNFKKGDKICLKAENVNGDLKITLDVKSEDERKKKTFFD